jgi:hypothetical protein
MSSIDTQQYEELHEFSGVYLDAYNAIVKPRQIFPASRSALLQGVLIADAAGFWLLVALQQHTTN